MDGISSHSGYATRSVSSAWNTRHSSRYEEDSAKSIPRVILLFAEKILWRRSAKVFSSNRAMNASKCVTDYTSVTNSDNKFLLSICAFVCNVTFSNPVISGKLIFAASARTDAVECFENPLNTPHKHTRTLSTNGGGAKGRRGKLCFANRIDRVVFTEWVLRITSVARHLICTAFRYVDFPRSPIDDTRVAFHRIRLNLYIANRTWRINKELFH